MKRSLSRLAARLAERRCAVVSPDGQLVIGFPSRRSARRWLEQPETRALARQHGWSVTAWPRN